MHCFHVHGATKKTSHVTTIEILNEDSRLHGRPISGLSLIENESHYECECHLIIIQPKADRLNSTQIAQKLPRRDSSMTRLMLTT